MLFHNTLARGLNSVSWGGNLHDGYARLFGQEGQLRRRVDHAGGTHDKEEIAERNLLLRHLPFALG